jgi:hypothetical protein
MDVSCPKSNSTDLSFETFVVQIPVATAASKTLLAAGGKIVWRVELFGPNHEIE